MKMKAALMYGPNDIRIEETEKQKEIIRLSTVTRLSDM